MKLLKEKPFFHLFPTHTQHPELKVDGKVIVWCTVLQSTAIHILLAFAQIYAVLAKSTIKA